MLRSYHRAIVRLQPQDYAVRRSSQCDLSHFRLQRPRHSLAAIRNGRISYSTPAHATPGKSRENLSTDGAAAEKHLPEEDNTRDLARLQRALSNLKVRMTAASISTTASETPPDNSSLSNAELRKKLRSVRKYIRRDRSRAETLLEKVNSGKTESLNLKSKQIGKETASETSQTAEREGYDAAIPAVPTNLVRNLARIDKKATRAALLEKALLEKLKPGPDTKTKSSKHDLKDAEEPSPLKTDVVNAKDGGIPETLASLPRRSLKRRLERAKKDPERVEELKILTDLLNERIARKETFQRLRLANTKASVLSAVDADQKQSQPDAASSETQKPKWKRRLMSTTEKEEGPSQKISKPAKTTKKAAASLKKTRRKTVASEIDIERIKAGKIKMVPIERPQPPVPTLSYGLDRVLFNPGVYQMQDLRSRVFNFDPYLAEIMPVKEFDFDALKKYVTSSKDMTLINLAKEYGRKYTGSTSSMTAVISQFHFLLSAWRPLNLDMLSASFTPDSYKFTRITRAPAACFLHWKDGTYAIDADKEYDTANILSMLGKSMEKLLTLPRDEYEKYRKTNSQQLTPEDRDEPEAFHYTTLGDFLMRSQLDAYDPRIPGSGMFDLKTRAVVSIRMDAKNFQNGLGYEINSRIGQWNSYEREYCDMIRSAFLKYSLQVRMGRMDGIFVAFHNTERIFGFQYVPLEEMDRAIHGTDNTRLGDNEFKLSLMLLNKVLNRATEKYPDQPLRLHFETRESSKTPFMYIFAKPTNSAEVRKVQDASKDSIEKFEREMLGLGTRATESNLEPSKESDIVSEEVAEEEEVDGLDTADAPRIEEGEANDVESSAVWEEVQDMVEQAIEDDEIGVGAVREAIEDALEQSGLLRASSAEETRNYVDALLDALIDNPPDSVDGDLSKEDYAEVVHHAQGGSDKPAIRTHPEAGKLEGSPKGSEESGRSISETLPSQLEKTEGLDLSTKATEVPTKGHRQSAEEHQDRLKEMFMSLTKQVDHKSLHKSREERRSLEEEDSSKLKDFERILADIVEKSEVGAEVQASPRDASALVTDAEITMAQKEALKGDEDESTPSTSVIEESIDDHANELLGMVLTVRNKVNGEYVERPGELNKSSKWDLEYRIEELEPDRANNIYRQLRERREKVMRPDHTDAFARPYMQSIKQQTAKGREFRKKFNADAAKSEFIHVYGEAPRPRPGTSDNEK